MGRHRDAARLEEAFCALHNAGAGLTGNTQGSDLEWLARVLFDASRLGAGDVRTVPWLIGPQEWELLGLTPLSLMGEGPRRWDALSPAEQAAWLKLARVCLYVLPCLAERVGHRFLLQAQALQALWNRPAKGEMKEER